jgi:hypothetical protein
MSELFPILFSNTPSSSSSAKPLPVKPNFHAAILSLPLLIVFILSSAGCKKESSTEPIAADTSSHNWTFTCEHLGDGASSIVYDVAIVNDTLAYAVGDLWRLDSTGQFDPKRYNLAVWNGRAWHLDSAPYYYDGQPLYNELFAIKVFNEHDIWLGGNGVIHWDGKTSFQPAEALVPLWGPEYVEGIWGTSSSDIWFVGGAGNVVHFAAGRWIKVQSGTTLNFQDVYGGSSESIGNPRGLVLAVASNVYQGADRRIVALDGMSATALSDAPIDDALFGVWFDPGRTCYVVGRGVYSKPLRGGNLWAREPVDSSSTTINAVRGNAWNDILAAGTAGKILHFNGKSWREYTAQPNFPLWGYRRMDLRGNLAIMVGEDYPYGLVAVGRR